MFISIAVSRSLSSVSFISLACYKLSSYILNAVYITFSKASDGGYLVYKLGVLSINNGYPQTLADKGSESLFTY